jgi:hypothetical protein
MDVAVEHTLADQELRPFEIRIAIEQGVVEVEQGEFHGVPPGRPKAAAPKPCERSEP